MPAQASLAETASGKYERMIEPRNDFGPFISAAIAGSAVWIGWWVWARLGNRGKLLRLAATLASIILFAIAALTIKGLF